MRSERCQSQQRCHRVRDNCHPRIEQQPYMTDESGPVTWRLRTHAIGCCARTGFFQTSLLRTKDDRALIAALGLATHPSHSCSSRAEPLPAIQTTCSHAMPRGCDALDCFRQRLAGSKVCSGVRQTSRDIVDESNEAGARRLYKVYCSCCWRLAALPGFDAGLLFYEYVKDLGS